MARLVDDHIAHDGEEGILTDLARIRLAEFLVEENRAAEAEPLLLTASSRILEGALILQSWKQSIRAMLATGSQT
jgi:hypothetical protein